MTEMGLAWVLLGIPVLPAQPVSAVYAKINTSVVIIKTLEGPADGSGLRPELATATGLGSGVVVSEAGEIMTAAHVVQTAEAILVELAGGEEIPARVVASAEEADVALLQLLRKPKTKLPVARLADSDGVKVGDQVVVIGAPYGVSHSLSVGYISGRHVRKTLSDGFTMMEFLQTDAAINQGNSGGPMLNLNGEVIGIVSYMLSQSGGSQGLGFVASSNIARKLLLEERIFWSGLSGYLLSGPLAEIFNLPQRGGIIVQKVASHSPAGLMGVRGGRYEADIEGQKLLLGGDIILAFDGIKLETEEDLARGWQRIATLKKDDDYEVTLLRSGEILVLKAKVP
jgi:serine protease Do